jgi:CBS domain-containing protein
MSAITISGGTQSEEEVVAEMVANHRQTHDAFVVPEERTSRPSRITKDYMVPLEEYASVSEGATLREAFLALKKTQEEFDHTRYRHRGILVLDAAKKVLGKISQHDVLRALEPKCKQIGSGSKAVHFGFSVRFLSEVREQFSLLEPSLEPICSGAANLKVDAFMSTLTEGEYVASDAPLSMAAHQLVMGHHQSLLVREGDAVVGILRLTDVFAAVLSVMKECEIL